MESDSQPNGPALAAFLAAGAGACVLGLFVILNEAGIFVAPIVYGPAGGISGRTTLAVAAWLAAWVVLHRWWRDRRVEPRPVFAVTLLLVGSALVATFPPLWRLF